MHQFRRGGIRTCSAEMNRVKLGARDGTILGDKIAGNLTILAVYL